MYCIVRLNGLEMDWKQQDSKANLVWWNPTYMTHIKGSVSATILDYHSSELKFQYGNNSYYIPKICCNDLETHNYPYKVTSDGSTNFVDILVPKKSTNNIGP